MIIQKSPEEIEKIAAAGRVLARCLSMLHGKARPGVTTADLDEAAEKFIRSQGGEPAFKGYRGFPGSICASPNSMVVHGIPGDYELKRGDVLSTDVGVVLDGWVADAAITIPIGNVTPLARRLLGTTRAALFEAVEACRVGNRLGDISNAVQRRVEQDGFSVIRSLVGHGIGRDMHEDPQIPNVGEPGTGPELAEGMVFAIEPMVNAGAEEVRMGSDNWAVYSRDGSLTAHFEHTVAITAEGPRILTPWHEQAALKAA
ncbi:MAG: methionyl aminopeptidase [Frankiales bacterium]|nr:methionyl aminopeptidase [Frankiales bacterium]